MSDKKSRNESSEPEPTTAELVEWAWKAATNRETLTVKARKGDAFPLLSEWRAGDSVYRVVGIFANGNVEMRIIK